ncbi:sugar kinase [Paenibacillus sp. NPDC056933]|uniref:sugar kinase n=1 Tax=Paenibacillus sp. NPDC056933 TaxID=3345968 RepID=UPI00362B4925
MVKRVGAFGEVMMRLEVPGHDLLIQSNRLKYSFSGSGVNVVSAMTRYGYAGLLVSRLPINPLGDAAESYLRGLGLSTEFVLRGGQYIGMYFLENGYGARPGRVTYSNRLESSFNMASEGTYSYAEIASGMDAIHFCGITLAMNNSVRLAMKSLAQEVKEQGGTVVFDCNYRPTLWGDPGYAMAKPHYEEMMHLSDIVLMNERDALHILGLNTDKVQREEQLAELIPMVAERYAVRTLAGTHRTIYSDNRHCLQGYIFKQGAFEFSEPLTFSVYDRIGAGDAFASGIMYGELEGMLPTETISFAVTAGMLAHTVAGDTPMATVGDVIQARNCTARDVTR